MKYRGRDEIHDDANENYAANNRINNNKTITSKSFEYNTNSIGSTMDFVMDLTFRLARGWGFDFVLFPVTRIEFGN